MLENGFGIEKNQTTALRWYEKSGEQNYLQAQKRLAKFYKNSDKQRYFYWVLKLAQNNEADFQYKVAELYEKGIGTKKDIAQSLLWCKKSADL